MKNMSSPLLRDPGPQELESVELEPFRDFEFDLQTSRLRVAGYSTEETAELLRLYREHFRLLAENAQLSMAEMTQAASE